MYTNLPVVVSLIVTVVSNYYFASFPYKENDEVAVKRRLSNYTYKAAQHALVTDVV